MFQKKEKASLVFFEIRIDKVCNGHWKTPVLVSLFSKVGSLILLKRDSNTDLFL